MAAEVTRRQFLKVGGGATAAAGLAVGGMGNAQASPAQDAGTTVLPYPKRAVGAAANLKSNTPVTFNYPDAASPCMLIKMDRPVKGGVGPNRDIVAYSTLCTHMGCPVAYDAGSRMFKCGCHFSTFDAEMGGQMVCGQATENLPRIVLEHNTNSGSITAVAVEGLIYGRQSNLL
jgi:arsenite oxidase small subunit